MIYHGVRQTAAGCLYRLGVALFALDEPERCLAARRLVDLRPRGAATSARATSATSRFPCGYTLGDDGDTINLYYGAADTSIALATGSVRELLRWLDEHGSEPFDALARSTATPF